MIVTAQRMPILARITAATATITARLRAARALPQIARATAVARMANSVRTMMISTPADAKFA